MNQLAGKKVGKKENPKQWLLGFLMGLLLFSAPANSQALSAIDDLGRVLPQHGVTGGPFKNRQVGLFYFLWQGDRRSPISTGAWDLTKIFKNSPAAFYNFNDSSWGGGAGVVGKYYYWGEPIYGYYRGDDYWVHLKNIQLLTDAGVDFLVIDATNGIIYQQQSAALFKAIDFVRRQQRHPPRVVYYTNTASKKTMQAIYDAYYRPGASCRYPDSWFYLEGKPLIIGHTKEAEGTDYAAFFTFRESQWPNEPRKTNGWPWIEFKRPQPLYRNDRGEPEIINVSAAQHPNLTAAMGGSAFYGASGNWGRSYHANQPGNPDRDINFGYNIQEQWDHALKKNPPFVFVTGWNEWIAGKWRLRKEDTVRSHFVDQASPEFSRDLEPSLTAGLRDHYYLQLVANIRKYKGMTPPKVLPRVQQAPDWEDWQQLPVQYTDYIGDIVDRHHPAAVTHPAIWYSNTTGRNDIEQLKLAVGGGQLYFYVRTATVLTAPLGNNWMTLWLNTDGSYESGWLGYDYRVIKGRFLQRYSQGKWQPLDTLHFRQRGRELVISLPETKLGISAGLDRLELKWSDNMQREDPLDWYINGDTAPGGRMNLLVRL